MYAAKRKLSGALRYDAAIDSSSAQNLSLLTELRRAVERNELRLYLQPKVPLHGQSGCAAEALVRWQHPQRGMVPPMEFIPFAEQTGFVRQLTLWMFEEVAKFLAQPAQQSRGLRVSVNLSTRDLLDPDLSHKLAALLIATGEKIGVLPGDHRKRHHGRPPAPKPCSTGCPSRASSSIHRRLWYGLFVAGVPQAAAGGRAQDRQVVCDGHGAGEDDAMIVRSTIDLAHNLGLTVVAEGVETGGILERLRALACDEAQGYHISRPMPAQEFLAWQQRQG